MSEYLINQFWFNLSMFFGQDIKSTKTVFLQIGVKYDEGKLAFSDFDPRMQGMILFFLQNRDYLFPTNETEENEENELNEEK